MANKDWTRNVRRASKRDNLFPAQVQDINGKRVSVRLSGNGAVYHNLIMTGGPAQVGELVHVDFTTPEPTVVAPSKAFDETDLDGAIARHLRNLNPEVGPSKGGGTGSDTFDNIWLIPIDGTSASSFTKDADGFTSALAAATMGDSVWLAPESITGDFTITDGVKVVGTNREGTLILGQVTLGDGSSLECLSVENSIDSASDCIAVLGPATGEAHIYECNLLAINCGAGDAAAFQEQDNTTVTWIEYSTLTGHSQSGAGYGVVAI